MDGSAYFISAASAATGLVAMPQAGRGSVFLLLWYLTALTVGAVLVSALARMIAQLFYRYKRQTR